MSSDFDGDKNRFPNSPAESSLLRQLLNPDESRTLKVVGFYVSLIAGLIAICSPAFPNVPSTAPDPSPGSGQATPSRFHIAQTPAENSDQSATASPSAQGNDNSDAPDPSPGSQQATPSRFHIAQTPAENLDQSAAASPSTQGNDNSDATVPQRDASSISQYSDLSNTVVYLAWVDDYRSLGETFLQRLQENPKVRLADAGTSANTIVTVALDGANNDGNVASPDDAISNVTIVDIASGAKLFSGKFENYDDKTASPIVYPILYALYYGRT